ncbi:MAG: Gfo/Idh/MocA family oxidoreductase [Clostridiales bacterium]|jgi:predicted dehydrogenase|nr:Gfo/Idh/MocA family oxidoreductase [Clostridiales bacterium]
MAVNFGILGCGSIARRFSRFLNNEKSANLKACAARDPEKAAVFAQENNAERACTYEELVRDPEVDAVYIATVHNRHYEQIKLCLENGKHVICEKPMVLHAAQARECFALAKKKNRLLMEGMWTRCLPAVRQATDWVSGGLIGEVKLVTANFCFNAPYDAESRIYNPLLAGGALYDVGVYVIEFATGVLRQNPENTAYAVARAATGADACVSLSLHFPSGAVASLNCAVNVNAPSDGIIYGTDGYIKLNDFWRAQAATRFDCDGNVAETFREGFDDGFRYEIRHVTDLIERGATESELIPPADTIACAEIFDQVLGRG